MRIPEIGEKRRGRDIGRASTNYFMWTRCPDCGQSRWVALAKGQPESQRCKPCAGKHLRKEDNPNWRGGRTILRNGYICVLLQPDDFFFQMADRYGYVKEHRLVMAKHLGRCLQPWEVVHHKGKRYADTRNKSDNLLDNLELSIIGAHSQAHSKGYRDGYQKGLTDSKNKRIHNLEIRITLLEAENVLLKEVMADDHATSK